MNPRLRRLQADFERVSATFKGHPHIQLIQTEGNPPEKYTFEFMLDGLVAGPGGSFNVGSVHRAEIFLPLDYPRRPPFCRMITPVFHPNIDAASICVGDHWTAGERLADLIIRIGEMIAYQAYNIKSPLDAQAAMWADLNADKFPIDPRNLHPAEM